MQAPERLGAQLRGPIVPADVRELVTEDRADALRRPVDRAAGHDEILGRHTPHVTSHDGCSLKRTAVVRRTPRARDTSCVGLDPLSREHALGASEMIQRSRHNPIQYNEFHGEPRNPEQTQHPTGDVRDGRGRRLVEPGGRHDPRRYRSSRVTGKCFTRSNDDVNSDSGAGSCQAGTVRSSTGRLAAQINVASSYQCRVAADWRRRPRATANPEHDERRRSSVLLPCFLDHLGNPLQLRLREPRAFAPEQRADDFLRGALEERVDKVPQRGFARGVPRHRRQVDVLGDRSSSGERVLSDFSTRSCVRTVE